MKKVYMEKFTFEEIGTDWGLVFNVPTDPEQRQALLDAIVMINHGLELLNPDSSGKITLQLN